MKLLLIGSLLFGGGSAVAMQSEEVSTTVENTYNNVRQMVRRNRQENLLETVKDTGFPYPTEERLENLTEDQQTALLTFIDQVNATYNWMEMTDEEILEALALVKEELILLHEELGIERLAPENAPFQHRGAKANGYRHGNRGAYSGDGIPCDQDDIIEDDVIIEDGDIV